MVRRRKIIEIDEKKCNGCGQCVSACAEGALELVNGKAKLVKDIFCDGLGACIGECPEGALKIIEREATLYNEKAVERRMEGRKEKGSGHKAPKTVKHVTGETLPCGCPSSQVKISNRRKALTSTRWRKGWLPSFRTGRSS
jgi:ferredoxin